MIEQIDTDGFLVSVCKVFENTSTCSEQMMRGRRSDPSAYNEEVVSKSYKRVQSSPEQTTEPKRGEKDQSKQKKPLIAYTSKACIISQDTLETGE